MSEPGSPKMQFDVVSLRLGAYEFVVDTDEPDGRLNLLHDNVRKYGTVFDTVAPGTELSYQVAFNRLDIMTIHGLQGAADEESDRGRQGDRAALSR